MKLVSILVNMNFVSYLSQRVINNIYEIHIMSTCFFPESFNTLVQNYGLGTSPTNVLTISQVINEIPEEDIPDDGKKSSHRSKVS